MRSTASRLTFLAALVALAFPAAASTPDVSNLVLPEPIQVDRGPAALVRASGEYVVTLSTPSVARAYKAAGGLGKEQQRAHAAKIAAEQDIVAARVRALGGSELGRVDKALNALVVSIDARQAREIEQMDQVLRVRPLNRYELDLSETVPHIGAAAVQAAGKTGKGVRVAVLDSGIDYTHAAFGGAGTAAAYAAAYGANTADERNKSLDGLFPTGKVIGGYDFVGEEWPGTAAAPKPRSEDPDPIDCSPSAIGCGGGHGTHVADIIAGIQAGKAGVAPDAKLYAVKVCSAVSTSCNGTAMMLGVDFALDPDRDGDISDRVDVINLSLGASYGQDEDDISGALNAAADLGVIVVASAGNSGDKPYVMGSPSSAANVISVAQTHVPSRKLYRIVAGTRIAGGSWQPWSAAPTNVTGPLAYASTNAKRLGCSDANGTNPFVPGEFAGRILLMDRGSCSVSLKVANAATAGAIAAIVANNAAQPLGDLPVDFSFGGGAQPIAGYTVTLADGNSLKGVLNVATNIDPANAASLAGNMAATSSRGPTISRQSIKPDIGAPGASLSAEVGTGTLNSVFGGTSGAAPMVSGSAALMLEARPGVTPPEVKSLMMNTADRNVGINPISLPGFMAPITRIGGGEIRIDQAIASQTAAWDKETRAASLSFGYLPIAKQTKLTRKVVVRNYGATDRTYVVSTSFRYPDDAATGAVSVNAPVSVSVPAGGATEFDVVLRVDASRLGTWSMNGGARGGDGFGLAAAEFDGYVTLDGGPGNRAHLAWHVLPHRAAEVEAASTEVVLDATGAGQLQLTNQSAVLNGRFDVFSLTGESGRIPRKYLPGEGENYSITDIKSVGVRLVNLGAAGLGVQFAIDTFGMRAHPNYPAEFDIYIDADRDGEYDAVVFNLENGGFAVSGQNVVASGQLIEGGVPIAVRLVADADLNSGNIILTAPLSALGLTAGTTFDFGVYAFDNYFTGELTDALEGMRYTLDTPRYVPAAFSGSVPAAGSASLGVSAVAGGDAKSPSQAGLLLLYRDHKGKAISHEGEAIRVR